MFPTLKAMIFGKFLSGIGNCSDALIRSAQSGTPRVYSC
jgi:hypothetical protein